MSLIPPSDQSTSPTVSVTSPAELAALIPYLLGFQPVSSVVAVALAEKAVVMTARFDAVPTSYAAECAERYLPALSKAGADCVLLVSFEEDPGECRPLESALARVAECAGHRVIRDIVVRGDEVLGADGWGPGGGARPLPAAADVAAVAEFVGRGVVVQSDREALVSLVTPRGWPRGREADPGVEALAARVQAAGHGRERQTAADATRCLTLWGEVLRGEVAVSEEVVPRLVGPLVDRTLRDALIAWLVSDFLPLTDLEVTAPGYTARLERTLGPSLRGPSRRAGVKRAPETPGAGAVQAGPGGAEGAEWPVERVELVEAETIQERLDEVCRATPWRRAPLVLVVSAAFAWWRGNGARASTAVDIALEIDPAHRLCGLIRLGLEHGLNPAAA